MSEASGKITPAQLLGLAQQLKRGQNTAREAQALEELAQTGISDDRQAQLHALMQDKAKLAQMLQSPQAQALMQKLNKREPE